MERDDVRSEAEADASAVQSAYGPTTSPAELVAAIHAWRRNIPAVSSLQTDIRGGRDHVRGDPAAPVVVVEYGDYQCTECAEAHTLRARVQPWLETGRLCVAFRHFPLVDAHPHALRAARAAEAAGLQGRFWEVHDALMRRVSEGRALADGDPSRWLETLARRAGLDLERFRLDIDTQAVLDRVLEDFRGGLGSGVNGTPTWYLNGRRVDTGEVEEVYALIAAAAETTRAPAARGGGASPS